MEGEEEAERSRLRFLTRPRLRKMSRSREIESEIRFRWREVDVKSWDNSISARIGKKRPFHCGADTIEVIGFLGLVFQKTHRDLSRLQKFLRIPLKAFSETHAETLLEEDLSAVTLNAAGWSLTILLPSRVTLFSLGCISCWRVCRNLMVELSRTRWMWRSPTQPTRRRARLMSGRWLSPPTEIFRKAREGRVRKVPFCKQEGSRV